MVTIDPRLVTTAFEIPGYQVTACLGVVRGITVRSLASSWRGDKVQVEHQPALARSAKDDEGWFGTKFPEQL